MPCSPVDSQFRMKSPHAVSAVLLSVFLLLSGSLNGKSGNPGAGTKPAKAAAKEDRNSATAGASSQDDLILATMEKELHRAHAELARQDPAPYFTSYSVTDGDGLSVIGTQGTILTAAQSRRRVADVAMRIGDPKLDNTHGSDRGSGVTTGLLPLRDDSDALARSLCLLYTSPSPRDTR